MKTDYNFKLKYNKILTNITIKGPLGERDFLMIVDTGSAYTLACSKLLESIGYTSKDVCIHENLKGFAGGSIKVGFVEVENASIQPISHKFFRIGITQVYPTAFYDGILGIDFLMNHKLAIDFKAGILTFE